MIISNTIHKSAWISLPILLILVCCSSCSTNQVSLTNTPAIQISEVQFLNPTIDYNGISWMREQAKENPLRLDTWGIYAIDSKTAFLFGDMSLPAGSLQSILLRTDDSGKHWNEVMNPIPASSVIEVTILQSGEGWSLICWTVEGIGEVSLYHTVDYGKTWNKLSDVPKKQVFGYPTKMTFSDRLNGQIDMNYEGDIHPRVAFLTTKDGGRNWQETGAYSLEAPTTSGSETAIAQYRQNYIPNLHETFTVDGEHWKLDEGEWNTPNITIKKLTLNGIWVDRNLIPKFYKLIDNKIQHP